MGDPPDIDTSILGYGPAMGDATHRVRSSKVYEFTLRTPTTAVEVQKAIRWAQQKFNEVKGRQVEYDDDIWVTADEEQVIIYFKVEDA